MKVLFVQVAADAETPELRVHRTLAGAAAASGLWATFLVTDRAGPPTESPAATYRTVRSWSDPPATAGTGRSRHAAITGARLARLVGDAASVHRDIGPEIVYSSQQRADVLVGRALATRFGVPHVIHLHYHLGPWLGRATARHIAAGRHLIAVSESVRSSALLRGVDPERIHTVHNPTTGSGAHLPSESRRAVRRSLGIDPDTPVVLAAGRLDPGKGHGTLLDAAATVLDEVPDARFLVCGESSWGGDHGDHLRRRARELGIADGVRFLGHRDDLPDLLGAADLFCLPAELEPFGLVYLEAMQAGLPVVACWSGGVPEIVLHERTGLLALPGDSGTLASRITTLLADPALRRAMGDAGRRRAAESFDPVQLGAGWYRLLVELRQGAARARGRVRGG